MNPAAPKDDITVRVPVTCVFLAFAFPFQVFPLSAADERRHGGIAVLSFCKQTTSCSQILLSARANLHPQGKDAKSGTTPLQEYDKYGIDENVR